MTPNRMLRPCPLLLVAPKDLPHGNATPAEPQADPGGQNPTNGTVVPFIPKPPTLQEIEVRMRKALKAANQNGDNARGFINGREILP